MDQRIIEFCDKYKDEVKNITDEYSSEPDKLQEEVERLERQVAGIIKKANMKDEEKLEILGLFTTEDAKFKVVQSLKNDDNKIRFLEQFHDRGFVEDIIKTIDDDDLKFESLKYVASTTRKADIFVTLKDKGKILSFLEKDSDIKDAVVQFLKIDIKNRPNRMWDFMKKAGLENEIIPYVLYDTKYEILNSRAMTDSMKQDIENYLGRSIPENIEELSMYEKIGINLEALQEEVITSEKQLGLDELQKQYFSLINDSFGSPKEEPKRKVSIKDFEGTFRPTLKEGVSTLTNWKDLLFGLKRMEYNIKKHSEEILFNPEQNEHLEALGLECINGKYYVRMNGNHRMTILKAKYLSEVKNANGDPKKLEEIEEKYTIEASYVKELPKNPNELMGIHAVSIINRVKGEGNDSKIKELVEDGRKTGYILISGESKSIIKSESELQEYLKQEIDELKENDEGKLFEEFNREVKVLNLDYPENEEYKKAFEEITGISLEQESTKLEELTNADELSVDKTEEITTEKQESNIEVVEEENIMQEQEEINNSKDNVELWMNRYRTYNGMIDRLSQNLKAKFMQIKSDIVKEIKEKLKERATNTKQAQNKEER